MLEIFGITLHAVLNPEGAQCGCFFSREEAQSYANELNARPGNEGTFTVRAKDRKPINLASEIAIHHNR